MVAAVNEYADGQIEIDLGEGVFVTVAVYRGDTDETLDARAERVVRAAARIHSELTRT
jgi:hypothetical protein